MLPDEHVPKEHNNKFKQPVYPLRLALYGHPDAGGYWERHCSKPATACRFVEVESWLSTFLHPQLKLMLMVYMDDVKLSGPERNISKGWALLRSKLKLEDPKPVNKCFGCRHRRGEEMRDGVRAQTMEYDLSGFMKQCVEATSRPQGASVQPRSRSHPVPFPHRAPRHRS